MAKILRAFGDGVAQLILSIIVVSCLLSFFIPNAVTVLTLLPVLKALVEQDGTRSLATPLTLAAIYGANIGGMGSLVGSPANLLLIGALDFLDVPGRARITFLNWFFWSVPLVIVLSLVAWRLIIAFNLPEKNAAPGRALRRTFISATADPSQRYGAKCFFLFLAFWTGDAVLKEALTAFQRYENAVCLIYFFLFIFLTFIRKPGGRSAPLLRITDLASGFPLRGLLFVGLPVVIILLVRLFHIDDLLTGGLFSGFSPDMPPAAFMLSVTTLVIFLTEIFSNTIVAAAFFPIAHALAGQYGAASLGVMIAVSAASTCAFMTPVATPCNALAYGEMRHVSLSRMLFTGAALNCIGAVFISLWLLFAVPRLYG